MRSCHHMNLIGLMVDLILIRVKFVIETKKKKNEGTIILNGWINDGQSF